MCIIGHFSIVYARLVLLFTMLSSSTALRLKVSFVVKTVMHCHAQLLNSSIATASLLLVVCVVRSDMIKHITELLKISLRHTHLRYIR